MSASLLAGLAAAAEEDLPKLPAPPWLIGVAAFVVLLVLLAITLAFGKGRPHS